MALSLAETAQAMKASLDGPDRARGESESIRLAFSFIEMFERGWVPDRVHLLEEAVRFDVHSGTASPSW